MIEEIIPGNKTRLKIIKSIYENPRVNLTGLIKKVKASPNLVLEYVNKLSSYQIIKEERTKGEKKIHVRNLIADFDNDISKIIYSIIEINKRLEFLRKYKNLKPIFEQLTKESKNIDFIIIYGSYARLAAEKDSDLDVIIIGKLNDNEINWIREIFITLEGELSLKIETINDFLKNKNKPLYQNILKEHIIMNGVEKFMNIMNKVNM